MWSTEKFPIDTCPPKHKKPPSLERRRKSAQRESLAFGCITMATPLESIICPLELAGESYRRVWGDYLCSSPMVFQLCSASLAPSLNGFPPFDFGIVVSPPPVLIFNRSIMLQGFCQFLPPFDRPLSDALVVRLWQRKRLRFTRRQQKLIGVKPYPPLSYFLVSVV